MSLLALVLGYVLGMVLLALGSVVAHNITEQVQANRWRADLGFATKPISWRNK